MKSFSLMRFFLAFYLIIFFGYLLGPLIVMSVTAFNSPSFPKASPWECLTFEWFVVLYNDDRIINGIKNSLIVGAGTVILSILIGLAGALVLTQMWPKLRATYYTVVIAPILIPGVVLGISTLVFWDRIAGLMGWGHEGILHNGIFLTVIGQTTFISSYCMLMFIARLQRFDPGLTEAALDLGASHTQAFRKVLLPFLYPAIGSAVVLAFLASFENYNTTTFTFGKFPTLTIELAQKVRYGINPSISALAFLIVALTVLGALAHEVHKRRQQLALANGAPLSAVSGGFKLPFGMASNPAALVLALFIACGLGAVIYSQTYNPAVCKAHVLEQKKIETDKRIQELQQKQKQKQLQKALQGPNVFGPESSKVKVPEALAPSKQERSPGVGTFGDVFDPNSLQEGGEAEGSEAESPGKGTFGDVFNPGNLQEDEESSGEEPKDTEGSSQ